MQIKKKKRLMEHSELTDLGFFGWWWYHLTATAYQNSELYNQKVGVS